MSVNLVVPKSFGPPQVAEWFERWNTMRTERELTLSFSSAAFVFPAGLTLLAAGIAARRDEGLLTTIAFEGASDTLGYLQRIDFFRVLGLAAQESFERHAPKGRFVPLQAVVDLKIARRVADETADCLEVQVPGLSPSVLRAARFVLEELGANIVQHSGRAVTGFSAAQAYPQRRRLQISFADAGVGFLRSLQRNVELAGRLQDEGEALQFALERGLSGGDRSTNMGIGLSLVRSFADELDADLWLASGSALLWRRTVAGKRVNSIRTVANWTGAWICLDAPLPVAGVVPPG